MMTLSSRRPTQTQQAQRTQTALPLALPRLGLALLVGLCTLALLPACSTSGANTRLASSDNSVTMLAQADPAPGVKVAPKLASQDVLEVHELQQQAVQREGERVRVRGVPAGFRGACRQAPPVLRSDWMLDDASLHPGSTQAASPPATSSVPTAACIYVSGRVAAAPADPAAAIVVEGTLRRAKDGQFYLQLP